LSGTNRECRVETHTKGPDGDDIVHHQPLYANLTCGGCMSKECLARVPDECRKAGTEITGDGNFEKCDVSESGKLEYLTSWSQIEKAKEMAIKPDEFKRCTFECRSKWMMGMTKTCKNDMEEPQYASVSCAKCGTAECTNQVQEKCVALECNAELGPEYGNYILDSAIEKTCSFGCTRLEGSLFKSPVPCRPDKNSESDDGEYEDDEVSSNGEKNEASDEHGNETESKFRFRSREVSDEEKKSEEDKNLTQLVVNVTCFDCTSEHCRGMVAPKCIQESAEFCDSKKTWKDQLIKETPVLFENVKDGDEETTDDDDNSDDDDDDDDDGEREYLSKEGKQQLEAFGSEMSVEESEEQKAAMSAKREIEGRIAFDRWMNFAKIKSDCDSFPFCNHVPRPPPLMPAPLDLEKPRANVKYPYVPSQGGAPFSYSWNTNSYPVKRSNIAGGEAVKPRKPGMQDGTKPVTITGITSPTSEDGQTDVGHMYDVGYRPTEAEEKPFTKSSPADNNWGYQFNLYRPALGELDDVSNSHEKKSEGETYPDWMNPENVEENWKMLSGDTFDVFDAASSNVVKGHFPSDPLVQTNENPVGDIPGAPLSGRERHESFMGADSDVRLNSIFTHTTIF